VRAAKATGEGDAHKVHVYLHGCLQRTWRHGQRSALRFSASSGGAPRREAFSRGRLALAAGTRLEAPVLWRGPPGRRAAASGHGHCHRGQRRGHLEQGHPQPRPRPLGHGDGAVGVRELADDADGAVEDVAARAALWLDRAVLAPRRRGPAGATSGFGVAAGAAGVGPRRAEARAAGVQRVTAGKAAEAWRLGTRSGGFVRGRGGWLGRLGGRLLQDRRGGRGRRLGRSGRRHLWPAAAAALAAAAAAAAAPACAAPLRPGAAAHALGLGLAAVAARKGLRQHTAAPAPVVRADEAADALFGGGAGSGCGGAGRPRRRGRGS